MWYIIISLVNKHVSILPITGGTGQRGSGKGRGSVATLPYVIPCTSNDTGQTSDSSDGNSDDKRTGEVGKVWIYCITLSNNY